VAGEKVSSGMKNRRKILLVDDEAAPLNLMGNALLGQGYEVLFATSYGAAMNMFGRHQGQIDLLVADVTLPDRSGFELACDLSGIDGSLKVLFVSGKTGAEVFKFHHLRAPEHQFLQKPFAKEDLVSYVKSILGPAVTANTHTAG
jgi:DNA-binding response OmpR family regulator